MERPKTHLSTHRIRLESAFAEPVYERFRMVEKGRELHLLAFVRPISPHLSEYLRQIGARPSEQWTASCYQELWECSQEELARHRVTL